MTAPDADTLRRQMVEELVAVPGGKVLTPWRNTYYPGGLLSLTVSENGTAIGRIVDRTWFMQLRDQRVPQRSVADVVCGDYHGEKSTTTVHPYELAGHRGAMLAIGLRVPQCRHQYFSYDPDGGTGELWFLDPWSGSWASHFHFPPDCSDHEFSVRQRGPAGSGMRFAPRTPGGSIAVAPTSRTGCSPLHPTSRPSI